MKIKNYLIKIGTGIYYGGCGLIVLAIILTYLVTCGTHAYREIRGDIVPDTIRDTVVIHDTVVGNYRDLSGLKDTIRKVKFMVGNITRLSRNIDAYEEHPAELHHDLLYLRKKLNEIKLYVGDSSKLGNIYNNAYDEGYDAASTD